MKPFLKNLGRIALILLAAVLMVEFVQPAAEAATSYLFNSPDLAGSVLLGVTSLTALKNIPDQAPNPAGVRRIFAILVADMDETVVDWPKLEDITAGAVTVAIPLKAGKTLATIVPADNSAEGMFENQGDRYYQSYKHGISFDIAGNRPEQKTEAAKFVNAGCIFLVEQYDGQIDVHGTKLSPIVLKQKGQTGKKGGDKRGRTFSGDNDNYIFEPPVYPSTLALPLPVVV
ncbi:hypothetical protein [Spirosoma rigui]|uniref:hypothetical protein n=1 Tax=Spirosoma rigui TaxID=564064 RepID=UPI0009AF8212|nr:hypothetical protein [Spirosoma rigui]